MASSTARTHPAPEQAQTLGFLLRELYQGLQERVYAFAAANGHPGLRKLHSPVLRHLPPEGARVVELAQRCGLAKQSVAYIVEDLVSLGYVTVTPDPDDARAKRVKLTARGRSMVQCLLAASTAAENEFTTILGEARMTALRKTLEDLMHESRREKPPSRQRRT